jgi:hypothetical protein
MKVSGHTQLNEELVVVGRREIEFVMIYVLTQYSSGPNNLLEECSHQTTLHLGDYDIELPI